MTSPPAQQQILQRARQFLEAGRSAEAQALYRQVLANDPNSPAACNGMGIAAIQMRDAEQALRWTERAVRGEPANPDYYRDFAIAHRSGGRNDEALRILTTCAQRFPRSVNIFRELGATYYAMHRPAESLLAYEQSLRLRAAAHAGELEASEREIDSRVWVNIGADLDAMGRHEEAIAANTRALSLNPGYATAHMNRGLMLFRQGRLSQAFADYESRWKVKDFTSSWPDYRQPVWDGTDLGGRTILLWHEQGMGDTIQFARYVPLVQQRGGRVILLCQPQLKRLMETVAQGITIVGTDDRLPPFDVHLPLLSLPHVFRTEKQTIPFPSGYLRARPDLVANWSSRLQNEAVTPGHALPLRVGLVWTGAPGNLNNSLRSIPPSVLAPLFSVTGVQFYSLQKGDASNPLIQLPAAAPIVNWTDELADFADTAALAWNLDLVISVCTSPAHLVGALGKEVWTLLAADPDFRWLWDKDRSSWYSSMRLFRQPRPGDWAGLVAQVVEALRERAGLKNQPVARQPLSGEPTLSGLIDGTMQLAIEHYQAGRLVEAEKLLLRILGHNPNHANAIHHLGLLAHQRGDNQQAVSHLRKAVELDPTEPTYSRNLSAILRIGGQLQQAISVLEEALKHHPASSILRRDLGQMLQLAGRSNEAINEYQEAIRLRQDAAAMEEENARKATDADLYLNLGVAFSSAKRHEEALAATDKAIELQPDNFLAHLNRAGMRFRKSDLLGGFEDYEWRWHNGTLKMPDFTQPLWDGADLNGKTILFWNEQGFGDTVQFLRYVPMVLARGGRVVIRCQPELHRLLSGMPGVAEVVVDGHPLPHFDTHAPFMGLPRIFRTTLETLPAPRRYLTPATQDIAKWSARLASEPGGESGTRPFRVGVVWAGSLTHKNDANRSMPIEVLGPLIDLQGVRFYSLQKSGAGRELPAVFRGRITDWTAELTDFAETAALIDNLDLVISVDTAVAHLAGALDKETWLFLPAEPEFRWMFEQRQSRWYPSMRIFRQPQPGDWASLVREAEQELRVRTRNTMTPILSQADQQVEQLLRAAHEHHNAGRFGPAESLYRQVLARQPANAAALHHLGLIAYQCGQPEPAIRLMIQAIEADATKPFFFKNLATVFRAVGRTQESAEHLRRAITLSHPDPVLFEELGVTLERLDRIDESIDAYEKAVALLHDNAPTGVLSNPAQLRSFAARLHSNLAAVLIRREEFERAMPHVERALALNPDYAMAHMHRASLLFRQRNLPAAFAEYEWRFRAKGFPTPWRQYAQPAWDGSPLNGKTILLWPEQGIGDVIQFARFVQPVIDRGGKVILQCMPALKRVMASLGVAVTIITTEEAVPSFDVHLPLISVPRVLGTTFESLPAPRSYLAADATLAEQWRAKLISVGTASADAQSFSNTIPSAKADPTCPTVTRSNRPFRVGLVWSGSPSFGYNHRRSIPREALMPLLETAGVGFFSLQLGEAAKQFNLKSEISNPQSPLRRITDLSPAITDFADSAAILANLDLLITTDTAIVHLAGALGIETWVLLWNERDFRWLMDDQHMPWYPSVRPFLQTKTGEWADVVAKVSEELRRRIDDHSPG